MIKKSLSRISLLFLNWNAFYYSSAALTNNDLVDRLKSLKVIKSPKVEKIMRQIDRKDFVPNSYYPHAYQDTPLPIGYNATISAPHMHACALVFSSQKCQNKRNF